MSVQHRSQWDNVSVQENTIRDLRRHVQQLEAQLGSLRQLNQPPTPSETTAVPKTQPQPRDRFAGESSHPSQAPDTCIPATIPRLRDAPDKTKLFGQSHWLNTAEKV